MHVGKKSQKRENDPCKMNDIHVYYAHAYGNTLEKSTGRFHLIQL